MLMFVRLPVESSKRLSHHVELGLAVTFKNLCVALSQHEGDKVVRDAASAESAGKGVPQMSCFS